MTGGRNTGISLRLIDGASVVVTAGHGKAVATSSPVSRVLREVA